MKVTSARSYYIAKAFVTKRIKPMTIDGKKVYQIGMPIHQGYPRHSGRCGQGRADARQPAFADGGGSQRLHAGIQGFSGEAWKKCEPKWS